MDRGITVKPFTDLGIEEVVFFEPLLHATDFRPGGPKDVRRQLPVSFALTHSFCYRCTIVASTEYYRNPEVNDGKKGKM